jgi:hypothetical protein
VLGRGRAEAESVDETDLGGRRERVESGAKTREVHPVQAVAIDRVGGDDANRDPLGAADDRSEELFPVGRGDLLRVVQQPERTDAVIAEAGVVEQHAGDDQRTGQGAPAGLVSTGDVAGAELAVEAKELLSGANGHIAEDSPAGGRVYATTL